MSLTRYKYLFQSALKIIICNFKTIINLSRSFYIKTNICIIIVSGSEKLSLKLSFLKAKYSFYSEKKYI